MDCRNGLKWAAGGLDIEPNFAELAALKTHRWHLIISLIRRSLDGKRIERARTEYSRLIAELQSRGYAVQTYQMPYLPAEHSVHSTFLDRLFGTVDVHGNEEHLMLYTNVARPIGAAMIWSLGRGAQGISVGSELEDRVGHMTFCDPSDGLGKRERRAFALGVKRRLLSQAY